MVLLGMEEKERLLPGAAAVEAVVVECQLTTRLAEAVAAEEGEELRLAWAVRGMVARGQLTVAEGEEVVPPSLVEAVWVSMQPGLAVLLQDEGAVFLI